MEEIKGFQEKFQSMSDEEKLSLVTNLYMQNVQAAHKLQQMDNQVMFKKLDYLFRVVECTLFGEEFTKRCEEEIKLIMFGEDTPEETTKEE